MKDDLSIRMKENYEKRSQTSLLRRMFSVVRLDGKSWHTYTRGLQRPFDDDLMADLDQTAIYLCENIQGAKLAYVQSDEISILLTDFDTLTTEMYFDGNVQKITSVSASLATAKFNQCRLRRGLQIVDYYNREAEGSFMESEDFLNEPLAAFDSRVFQLPNRSETINYFRWRQQDAVRNSISSVAESLYSHKELFGMNSNQKKEMIFQKGINWDDLEYKKKRGRGVHRVNYEVPDQKGGMALRSRWEIYDLSTEDIPYENE